MFKNILVCLDGSRLAEQILPYVTDEAILHKSRVTLIQVIAPPVVVAPGVPGAPGGPVVTETMIRQRERAEAEAAQYLEKIAGEMRGKEIKIQVAVTMGNAGDQIIDYAVNSNVDLIALATHGRSGLGRVIFGSVAEYVLRESGMPILLIKPGEVRG